MMYNGVTCMKYVSSYNTMMALAFGTDLYSIYIIYPVPYTCQMLSLIKLVLYLAV